MSREMLRVLFAVLVLVGFGGRLGAQQTGGAPEEAAPQEPPVAFPTEIEQVTVDVVVVDKEGQPVTDLRRGDIEVYEDGKQQAITSFDMFEVASPPAAEEAPGTVEPAEDLPPPSRVSTNTDRDDRQGRTFVVVFDDVHLTAFTAERAKAAIMEFVDDEMVAGAATWQAAWRR